MAISYEQVVTVIEQMVLRGETTSLRNVRAELGSGSLATIQKYLSLWRENRKKGDQREWSLPSDLSRMIRQEIEKAVREDRREREEDLARTQQEMNALISEGEEKERVIEGLKERILEGEASNQAQTGKMGQLETRLTESRDREEKERERVERVLQSLAVAETRLEEVSRLREEVESLRKELETEKGERVRAEKEAAVREALSARKI